MTTQELKNKINEIEKEIDDDKICLQFARNEFRHGVRVKKEAKESIYFWQNKISEKIGILKDLKTQLHQSYDFTKEELEESFSIEECGSVQGIIESLTWNIKDFTSRLRQLDKLFKINGSYSSEDYTEYRTKMKIRIRTFKRLLLETSKGVI